MVHKQKSTPMTVVAVLLASAASTEVFAHSMLRIPAISSSSKADYADRSKAKKKSETGLQVFGVCQQIPAVDTNPDQIR